MPLAFHAYGSKVALDLSAVFKECSKMRSAFVYAQMKR
jgi:hypothetical protein